MNLRLAVTKLLVVALLPLLLFSHHAYREGAIWDTLLGSLALTLLVAAAVGRSWAALYLAGRKNRELVTQGPYSIVRNPLYCFSFVGFVGAGLAFGSVALALLLGAVFGVGHLPTVRQEEARLRELFGEEFDAYARRVPRFLPRIGAVDKPDSISVSTGAYTRALMDAALIPMVFVVAHVLEWAKVSELLPVVLILP